MKISISSDSKDVVIVKSKDPYFIPGDKIYLAYHCNYEEAFCSEINLFERYMDLIDISFAQNKAINSLRYIRNEKKYRIFANKDGKIELNEIVHPKTYLNSKFVREYTCSLENNYATLKIDTIKSNFEVIFKETVSLIPFDGLGCASNGIICFPVKSGKEIGMLIIFENESFMLKLNGIPGETSKVAEFQCTY
ncbi:hypothetical protein CH352_14615 [Leptospira hartskeerlii]|uniref:Uncharacterized protein n=1 Tax=Leptospira hartskeerlii TaxID=2023177 RepID=A0A2M9XCK0_9LEPT|nr:hypothetical protein [Leptospira hartskeerlii]PJZ25451.1 hypothetical protein CH357_11070 [Leptospira hartskeerlii]PJZ32570.1 hypothetical protein CH352_14615 [Leptospira hartskeerlii]